jgi:hypothetical protein
LYLLKSDTNFLQLLNYKIEFVSGVHLNFPSKLALRSRLWTHHASVCRLKTLIMQKVRLDLNRSAARSQSTVQRQLSTGILMNTRYQVTYNNSLCNSFYLWEKISSVAIPLIFFHLHRVYQNDRTNYL